MRFSRNRHQHSQPELNMQSLPDLIFTVLFFFMIVTTMRSFPLKVKYVTPQGTNLTKLKKKPTTVYVFIGKQEKGKADNGENALVQINDKFVPIDQVAARVAAIKDAMLVDEQEQMTVLLKIDKDTPMGLVTDVKLALRQAGALKVHYAASNKLEANKNEIKR